MGRARLVMTVILGMLVLPGQNTGQGPVAPAGKETEACIECHRGYTPGIVRDWQRSRHARVTPGEGLRRPAPERRVSAKSVPASLQAVTVGCYECHGLNPSPERDTFDHFGFTINSVVSPNDCKVCHTEEAEQYAASKKAHALPNLDKNPVYSSLVHTLTGLKGMEDGKGIVSRGSSANARNETCYACHGTEVKSKGLKTITTGAGDMEVPDLTNMPNHGVGRINPDGSAGSCSACHARHAFSIEVARKPYTCAQCHLEPDVPAWNVYKESKHGNIFLSDTRGFAFDKVPWVVGRDFRVPTCATCHNSLVTNEAGEVVRKRTHDFGSRLWVRIFGLVYSHPQPRDGRTYLIRNGDGLPLPTTFLGEPASAFLIDKEEQVRRLQEMKGLCGTCHSSVWTGKFFERFHTTVTEADRMVETSTRVLVQAWKKGLAEKTNPFDETIEHLWMSQWLFHANSLRYGSAMGGPDYGAFKGGWWELNRTLEKMRHAVEGKKKSTKR